MRSRHGVVRWLRCGAIMLRRHALLFTGLALAPTLAALMRPSHALAAVADDAAHDDEPDLQNPYFPQRKWKVWRLDEEAVRDARVFVPPATAPPSVIELPAADKRWWPVAKPAKGRLFEFTHEPSKQFAGTWDDVYASWSGTHGWVRDRWAGPGGDEAVGIAGSIVGVVDQAPTESHFKLGINFYHQSTTGMAHTITNAVIPQNSEAYERLYFASGLLCSPCHLSLVEESAANAALTTDLYLTLMPTLFNSVGSSDSETMAITKLVIVGAHLKPEMKLLLKRSGLYASALLWLWKSCLPIEAEYDEEWRHRVAYAAVGDRFAFPGGYDAAGIARGDMCLDFHQYDDVEHLRRMIEAAKALDVAPPEAVVKLLEPRDASVRVALKKTIGVLQEAGQEAVLRVSTQESFDLAQRPLELRWKLLYGNRATRVARDPQDAAIWTIRVPWDESLPEGRTTLLLVANNGVHDGNPAAVTIYRKRGDLPPSGGGYNDYVYDTKFANRRPTLLGLQDVAVKPGETVNLTLRALDPEGQPLRYTKRAGDPGEFDGNVYIWKVPGKEAAGDRSLTVLCSDATSGSSYEAQTIALQVKPKLFARINADVVAGPAPLTIKFTSGANGKEKGDWAFAPRAPGKPVMPTAEASGVATVTKTFDTPGIYEAWLKVKAGSEEEVAHLCVRVTDAPLQSGRSAQLVVEGNGVFVVDGDATPSTYDHTDFGALPKKSKQGIERRFLLHNRGDAPLALGKGAVTIEGAGAAAFSVVQAPRASVEGQGSSLLRLRFLPKTPGLYEATVEVKSREQRCRFAVRAVAAE